MDKVTYKCKKCGWTKDITVLWADIKPVFCPNKNCELSKEKSKGKKSFRKYPELLEITYPKKKEEKLEISVKKKIKQKVEKVELKKEEVDDKQRKPEEVKS